jgi:hypothetical protein
VDPACLNWFVPIAKASLSSKYSDVASSLITTCVKIAKERGDDQKVIASSKLFGTHSIPLKPSQHNEIDASIKEVFDYTLKGIDPNEKQEITESFDFRVIIYDTIVSPNSRNYLITKPLRDMSTSNVRNIDLHDVAPSHIKMVEEEKLKKENAKKLKSEQDKAKKDAILKAKKEKEDAVKMNQHIITSLRQFALLWREKSREIKDEQQDTYVMNKIEQILDDEELGECFANYCKHLDDLYLMDVLFLQEVIDFVYEEGRIESVLTSKDIIEKYVKNNKLILPESVRSQVILEYGSNQSDPKKSTFKTAFETVCQRLENECYDGFLRSEVYQQFDAKKRKKSKK